MAELLEAVMLICFGLSWPLNAYKNYKAGTAVGTSWQFIALITAGCIAANWLVYFRNRRLDARRCSELVVEEETLVVA